MLLVAILSTTAFADTFTRKYEGQIFTVEQYAACETEYARITQKLDSLEGYLVLDGGCLALGEKQLKIKFNYEAPTAGNIERFRLEMKSKESCAEKLVLVENRINQSGNTHIASYCNGRALHIDYIDRTFSVLRDLRIDAKFTSKEICLAEIKNINTALTANGMHSLISFCTTVKLYNGGVYYRPNLYYTANYTLNLTAIKGRKAAGGCFNQTVSVERNFQDAGVVLAHKFCAEREHLIYVNKTRGFGELVKKYSGLTYDNVATCESELKSLISKFETQKRVPVYYYCDQLSEKRFKPTLHYAVKK